LSPESFRRVERDPLAALRSVSSDLASTLWGEQGCLECHSLDGVGSRAHHITAHGAPAGADALALEAYPPDVLRRFLFDQDAVAASFGVVPLRVPHDAAEALYALVTKRR